MFRRELPVLHGGYRQGDFPEDYELWLRWREAGVIKDKLPETLVIWNDPPGRLARTDPHYAPKVFFRIKAGYLARHPARMNPFHPCVVAAGAGRATCRRAELLCEHGVVIKAWLDIDPRKIGLMLGGRLVLHYNDAPGPQSCFIVPYVASRGATDVILNRLGAVGFLPGRHCLPAA